MEQMTPLAWFAVVCGILAAWFYLSDEHHKRELKLLRAKTEKKIRFSAVIHASNDAFTTTLYMDGIGSVFPPEEECERVLVPVNPRKNPDVLDLLGAPQWSHVPKNPRDKFRVVMLNQVFMEQ
jgi:hypothetical protein